MSKELIHKSIDYMLEHLDENLTVKGVPAHFHFSEHYFYRSFKAITGKSVCEFLMRLKMDQSAVDIKLEKHKRLTEIGLDYGYSASNFSSVFRKYHRVSPETFRKSKNTTGRLNPFYPSGQSMFGTFDDYANRIQIQRLRDFPVVYERFFGSYVDLKEQWPIFLSKYQPWIEPGALFLERYYDDPAITKLDDCIYDICVTVKDDCPLENRAVIPGGKFAVYHYEGAIQDIFCSIQGVFSVWLPQSGYLMEKRFSLNIFRKSIQRVIRSFWNSVFPYNRAEIQKYFTCNSNTMYLLKCRNGE